MLGYGTKGYVALRHGFGGHVVAVGGAIAVIAAGVLATSAVLKIRHHAEFRHALRDYHLLPATTLVVVAWAVPAAEAGVAGWLALSRGPDALIAASVILVLFTLAVISSLLRGLRHDCGCSGGRPSVVSWRLVVRNCAFIALTLIGAVLVGRGAPGAARDVLAEVAVGILVTAESAIVWRVFRYLATARQATFVAST